MKADRDGCSTCPAGEERFEPFTRDRQKFVQYDYRTPDGQLFSCVARTVQKARLQRDAWLSNQGKNPNSPFTPEWSGE